MKGNGIFGWALAATAAIRRAVDSPPTCVTGVHMIVARGSGEPAGLGRIAPVVNNVTLAIPGSDYTAVDYPATITQYTDSLAKGTAAFHRLIKEYTQACPNTKVVLLGYSQGAHAMMDTVCGSNQEGFQRAPELEDALKSQIVAIVAMGDPTHTPSAPWNAGTSQNNGFFPRPSLAGCEPYTPIMRGYCDTGDRYCDGGQDNKVHGSYFRKYTQDAVEFITQNFIKANASSATPPPPAESSAAPTSSVTTSTASSAPSTTVVPTTLSTVTPEPSSTASPTPVPASGNLVGPSALILMAGVVLSMVTLA